ncbi:MAG: hypothetical protein IJ202_12880 [Bacteroidales bacterium]|nr:hypothetical protein [Bacteroidales bacterium]
MSESFEASSLQLRGGSADTRIYELCSGQFRNRYFLLTSPLSRNLLAHPEVVGYDAYLALVHPTVEALRFLLSEGMNAEIDIMTILRGGLNYPIEEAAHNLGIRVRNMHFLSCERVIKDHVITGLDIKYTKIGVASDIILSIGDIFATGDTFRLCMENVVEKFRSEGGSIRRMLFFTIGGTRVVDQMEGLAEAMRRAFPGFEGINCFFYEGMFTVYTDKGVSGINVKDIDFGWKGGVVAPEFRRYVVDHPDALYEKCIIYDGGARRYEIPLHFDEVLEYWNGILSREGEISAWDLTAEKLGYSGCLSFEEWLLVTRFRDLALSSPKMEKTLRSLWEDEAGLFFLSRTLSLKELSLRRIESITKLKALYG